MSFWASANSRQGYAPGAQVGSLPRADPPAGDVTGTYGPLAGGFGERVPDPDPVPEDETPEEVPDGKQELHEEQPSGEPLGSVEPE
jgi:hypothetical protein